MERDKQGFLASLFRDHGGTLLGLVVVAALASGVLWYVTTGRFGSDGPTSIKPSAERASEGKTAVDKPDGARR